MKKLILTFILLCNHLIFSQSVNKEIVVEGEQPYLLGVINKKGLTAPNYNTWFAKNYDAYKTQEKELSKISDDLRDYTIKLFMGTWCGDSKREVPKFYKVLEKSNYPMDQLTVVAVSRKLNMYKQSPNHEEKGLNIHRVPTFIFYKNGVEINRIIETPVVSLEKDIENIINNNYASNYKTVTKVHKLLKEHGIKKFNRKVKNQIPKFKKEVKSMYELNSYAHILKTTNRSDEAIEVLKLNTKLFPEKANVFISLANTFKSIGNRKEALVNYKKGLKLNPDNKQVQKSIEGLKSTL